ncbi:breast cancer metastasis-suppressor 1-like protein-A [Neocloeon triangulifer]|uniref:breast cancer metastasis-suppressor 1-like protein-A n=1 Tax=Neocloeon triangulifer TaxID=2078957 RepID=UPI00286ECBDB|nr:breast cancer metastasis-suppressor 1-like protein-A [Neocloeon triangulifer]
MPVIKEQDRDESDAEDMEQDSNDSDKSSSSLDPSDSSDSDDSSEMDDETCARRRVECIEDLADLERQFSLIKEQLYRERVNQVEAKLVEVRCGKAHEYLQPLEDLEENMKVRMNVAEVLKKFRLDNIMNKFEAEELASHQNFESEKALLRDMINSDLEEKIRRLEDDRNNTDISSGLWMESLSKRSKKNRHGTTGGDIGSAPKDTSPAERRRKPVTVSGPYVVYMLTDSEILEDWTAIKKALTKRKSDASFIY